LHSIQNAINGNNAFRGPKIKFPIINICYRSREHFRAFVKNKHNVIC
jgi:hypothetical protein